MIIKNEVTIEMQVGLVQILETVHEIRVIDKKEDDTTHHQNLTPQNQMKKQRIWFKQNKLYTEAKQAKK